MKIQLPKAEDWSGAENCAINLRTVRSASVKMCEPVGMPNVVLADAGAATYLLDNDDVMTAGDDHHDLSVNGQSIGSLSAPLINVLPLGTPGEAILFTTQGHQLLAEGALQSASPTLPESVMQQGTSRKNLTADVLIPDLTGSYPRNSEMLDSKDAAKVTAAINDALSTLLLRAEGDGLFVEPTLLAWRLIDTNGNLISQGEPALLGAKQGDATLTFKLAETDNGLSLVSAPAITLKTWPLHVKVDASDSAFWRNRVASLEVLAWPVNARLLQSGYILSRQSGGVISLTASTTLSLADTSKEAPRVIARIPRPLDGVDMDISADFAAAPATDWQDAPVAVKPTTLYRGGSIVAYAEASRPGMLLLASNGSPLQIAGMHKICGGNILHICAPVGGGGGWNYGRLHLLVFATDGIYSVSVDSKLTAATSTCINYVGISLPDAVAATPECVYVATDLGQLLRIVGARCHMVPFPSEVTRLAWNSDRAELWAINSFGAAFVMDADRGVALRSNIYVDRVVGQQMVVDSFGALRTLRAETPAEVDVSWTCRCEESFRQPVRMARWKIDAAHVGALMLRLWADNGGASQRLLELKVDGTVNAPISARVVCPRRAYFTAQISGKITPPAHLNALDITV